MRYIFSFIFCVFFAVSMVASCDIKSVATLKYLGVETDITQPIIGANLSEVYTLEANKMAPNSQLILVIQARFDTLVSVKFSEATAANFTYKISKSVQNNQILCNQPAQNGHKSQDIKLKNGQNLLITFGNDTASQYGFEAEIVLEHMISTKSQSGLEAEFKPIYTQIIGREFELDFSLSQPVNDLEIMLNDGLEIYKSTVFNGGKIRTTIPNLANLNYKNLYLIAKFKTQKGEQKEIKSSNFTARPASFVLENTPQNPKGGAKYRDFRIIALDFNGLRIAGYSGLFKGDFIGHTLQGCDFNGASEIIEFRDGVGAIRTDFDSLIYPEIGMARIKFTDSQNSDKARDGCILNSATNTPDASGKIGCNAEIIQDIGEFGLDKIVHIRSEFSSKFGLFGTIDGNISKAEFDSFMGVGVNLIFEARLEDGTVPKLFSAGCYAQDVSFSNSSRMSFSAVGEPVGANLIYQSGDNIYTISRESFKSGTAVAGLKISLPRQNPQNPQKIELNAIDTNLTKLENLVPNLSQNSQAHLYYAKAYGTKLIQAQSYPATAKIKLAIYCDAQCQKIAKTTGDFSPILDENISELSELKDYFIFKDFNTTVDLIKFKAAPNYASNIINGVMDVLVGSDKQIEFKIKNTHFEGSDFIWVRPFSSGAWIGSGEPSEVLGVGKNQNIRYNRAIQW